LRSSSPPPIAPQSGFIKASNDDYANPYFRRVRPLSGMINAQGATRQSAFGDECSRCFLAATYAFFALFGFFSTDFFDWEHNPRLGFDRDSRNTPTRGK